MEYIAFIKPRANTSNDITTNTDDNDEGDRDRSTICDYDTSDVSSQQHCTQNNKRGGDNNDSLGGDSGKKRSLDCREDDRLVKKFKPSDQATCNNSSGYNGINRSSNNINSNSVNQSNTSISTQNTVNDSTKGNANLISSMLGLDEKNYSNLNSFLLASLTANVMPNVNNLTNAAPNNFSANQNIYANNQSTASFLSLLPASYFNNLFKGLYAFNDTNNVANNNIIVNNNNMVNVQNVENNVSQPQKIISNGISLSGNFANNNQNQITDGNKNINLTDGTNQNTSANGTNPNVINDITTKDTINDTSTGIHFDKSDSFSGSIDLFPDSSDQNSDINNSLHAEKNTDNLNNSKATQHILANQYIDIDKNTQVDNNEGSDDFKNTVSPIKIKYVKKSNKTGIYSIDNKEKMRDNKSIKGFLNRSRSKQRSCKINGGSLLLRDCRVVLKRLKEQEMAEGGVDVFNVKNNNNEGSFDNVNDGASTGKKDDAEKKGESYNSFICDLSENSLRMSIKKNQPINPATSSPSSITPIFNLPICNDHTKTTKTVVPVTSNSIVPTISFSTASSLDSLVVASVTPSITTTAASCNGSTAATTSDNIFNILQSTLNDKPKVNKLKMPVKKSLNSSEHCTKIKVEASQKMNKSKQFDSTSNLSQAMSKADPSYKANKLTDFSSNLVSTAPTTSSIFGRFSSMGPCYFNQKCNKRSSISNNTSGVNDAYINFFVNKKSYKNNKLTSKAQLTFFENTFSVNNNFNFLKYQYHSFFPTLTSINKRKPGTKSPRSCNPNTRPIKCNTSNFYRSSQYLSQLTHPFIRKNNYIMNNNEFEHKAINLKMNVGANSDIKSIGEGETSSLSSLITLTSSLSHQPVSSSQTPSKSCPPFSSYQPLSHEITKKSLFPIFKKPLKKQVNYSTNATNCGSLDLSYARIKHEKDEDLVEKDIVVNTPLVSLQTSSSIIFSSSMSTFITTSSLPTSPSSFATSVTSTFPSTLSLTTTATSLIISASSSVTTPSTSTPLSSNLTSFSPTISSSNKLNIVAIKSSTSTNNSPMKITNASSYSDTENIVVSNHSKTTSSTTVVSSNMVILSKITTSLTEAPTQTTTALPSKHQSPTINEAEPILEDSKKAGNFTNNVLSSSSSMPSPAMGEMVAVSDQSKSLVEGSVLSTINVLKDKTDDIKTVVCNDIVSTDILINVATTCSINNTSKLNNTPVVDIINKIEAIKSSNKEKCIIENIETNKVKILREENIRKESVTSLAITSSSTPTITSSNVCSTSQLVTSTIPIKETNKKPINIIKTSPNTSILVSPSSSIKNNVLPSKKDAQNDSIQKDSSRQSPIISATLSTSGAALENGASSTASMLVLAVTSVSNPLVSGTSTTINESIGTQKEVVVTLTKTLLSSIMSPIVSSISTSKLLKTSSSSSPAFSATTTHSTTTKTLPKSTIVSSAKETPVKTDSDMSTTQTLHQPPMKSKGSDDLNSPSKTKTFIIIQPDNAPYATKPHSASNASLNQSKSFVNSNQISQTNGCLNNEVKTCQPNNINNDNVKVDKCKDLCKNLVSTLCGSNKLKSSSGVNKVIISKSTYTTTILASTFAADHFNNAVNSVETEETMKSTNILKQNVDNLENIDTNINNVHKHNMAQTVVINLNDFQ